MDWELMINWSDPYAPITAHFSVQEALLLPRLNRLASEDELTKELCQTQATTVANTRGQGSCLVQCNAGDQLSIYMTSTNTNSLIASSFYNYLEISWQGN